MCAKTHAISVGDEGGMMDTREYIGCASPSAGASSSRSQEREAVMYKSPDAALNGSEPPPPSAASMRRLWRRRMIA